MITLEQVREMALGSLRRAVKEGRDFIPIAFLNGPRPTVVGCPFTEETKLLAFQAIGKAARKTGVTDLFLVVDTYVMVIEKKDAKWVEDNWDIEKPTMHPESTRQDALAINHIHFDGGKDRFAMVMYDKKGGEVVVRKSDECEEFDGLLKESVMKGHDDPDSVEFEMK